MSLVSEALKKAEREAAARDARDKGQPAPFEAPLQPYRNRRRATGGGARGWLFAALGGAAAGAKAAASNPTVAGAVGEEGAAPACGCCEAGTGSEAASVFSSTGAAC